MISCDKSKLIKGEIADYIYDDGMVNPIFVNKPRLTGLNKKGLIFL